MGLNGCVQLCLILCGISCTCVCTCVFVCVQACFSLCTRAQACMRVYVHCGQVKEGEGRGLSRRLKVKVKPVKPVKA